MRSPACVPSCVSLNSNKDCSHLQNIKYLQAFHIPTKARFLETQDQPPTALLQCCCLCFPFFLTFFPSFETEFQHGACAGFNPTVTPSTAPQLLRLQPRPPGLATWTFCLSCTLRKPWPLLLSVWLIRSMSLKECSHPCQRHCLQPGMLCTSSGPVLHRKWGVSRVLSPGPGLSVALNPAFSTRAPGMSAAAGGKANSRFRNLLS